MPRTARIAPKNYIKEQKLNRHFLLLEVSLNIYLTEDMMEINKVTVWLPAFAFIVLAACSTLFFKSSGCGPSSDLITGEHTITSDGIARVYYLKLPDNYDSGTSFPLIFAFHGFTGDYTFFSEGYYDLQEAVGDKAILVYLNALERNGETQWDYEADLGFFDDLYAELEANLCFDIRKVFAVGHSNGAGMTHALGCKRGNVLRAIGPVAGSLSDYDGCTGQVAVMMIHGNDDPIIPIGQIIPTREYWTAINNCSSDTGQTVSETNSACISYADCDPDYPVQFCEHSEGHDWPDFAGDVIWDFFNTLSPAIPSSTPGTGTVPADVSGTINFKILYPSDFVGTPDKLALSLYPAGSTMPLSVGPDHIFNMDIPLGDVAFGEVAEYKDVETNMLGVEYGNYALAVSIYVEGSSYPIPAPGKDYMGLQDITIDSSTITVETPFELEFVVY